MGEQDIEIKIQAALDASQAANSAKDLKASMRELNALANEVGDTNSEAYTRIKEAAGAAALKVREMNESTRALAGTPLTATTRSFGLLKENLMTMNFEALAKNVTLFSSSMGKLNPAGLTEGFGKLGTSLVSLGKTLLTNPIFLIGAAVAFIILKFTELKEAGGVIGKIFAAIGQAIHAVIKFFTDLSDAIGLTDIAGKKRLENQLKGLEAEKAAIEDRYKIEVEKAKSTHQSVNKLEEDKLLALYEIEQKKIALLETRKQKNGELTEEEKKNLEEYKIESKKALGEIELFYTKLYSEITEGQEKYVQKSKELYVESIVDPTKKAIEQAKLDRAGKEKDESESYSKQKQNLEELINHLTETQKGYGSFLNDENEKELKAAKENLYQLISLHKTNADIIVAIEKKADSEAFKAKAEKEEQAKKERLSKLKTADDILLSQNKATQDLITANADLSESQRFQDQIENINKRVQLLNKELKDGVLSKIDYENQLKKLTEDSEKLQSDFDEKARAKNEAAIKKDLADIVKLDTEKVKYALNDNIRLAANIQLVKDLANQRINSEKLTGDKLVEINKETISAIEKLNADAELKIVTDKQNEIIKIESADLAHLNKSKAITIGSQIKDLNDIQNAKQAILNANRNRELVGVEKGSADELKILKKYAEEEKLLNQRTQDAKKLAVKKAIDEGAKYGQEALQTATALSDIADAADQDRLKKGEKMSLATQQKEFKRHKLLAVGGAIMNTSVGVTKALVDEDYPGAIAIGIAGLAQLAKINSQKFEGADSGGSSDTPTAPSFGVAETLNTNSTAFRTGQFYGAGTVKSNSSIAAPAPQRVYVVESDITKAQNKVQVLQTRATLSGK